MSKGPFEGTITINNMSRSEAYEVYFALIHRHNEAHHRLNGGYDYEKNKACDRLADEYTVKTCAEIADAVEKLLD